MKKNKTIFITGAASGIGRATALHFAKNGWFVGLFDINKSALAKLHDEVGKDNSCFMEMDVTDLSSVKASADFFASCTKERMDVLFNCAGILRMGMFDQIDIDAQKKIIDINVNGILNCIDSCLPVLKKTKDSRILNMSSASAVYGVPELAAYSASKFAVRGLTEALNIEFEAFGITVSDIMAPYVQTPMLSEATVVATSVDRLGVRLTPEIVAETVWKAAHGKKVHWKTGLFLKLMAFASHCFPFANRIVIKLLCYSNKK